MIDLSADMGEGSPGEQEIWPLIDLANVACGGHVGDQSSMAEAVWFAKQYEVVLGAHPSYPDRENFGRKSLDIALDDLRDSLVSQISQLRAIAAAEGMELRHVKPHGALYNDAHKRRELAAVIVEAMRLVDPSLAIVAPDRSEMSNAARDAGTSVIREAFADRRYEPDGSLVSRTEPGALLGIEEAAQQAVLLARFSMVIARGGMRIAVPFETICLHADMEHAVERLCAVREALRVG